MAPKEEPRVLLVEGSDDKHVVWSLLEKNQIPEVFTVRDRGGITPLLESFEVYLDLGERIGIIVDADTNLSQRWVQIRQILLGAGFQNVPLQPDPNGTILAEPGRAVAGVWLMPDNAVPGILEHFIEFLVQTEDPLWRWAKGSIEEVPDCGQRFAAKDRQKALLHLWLAVQKDPGTPIGAAISKRYLNPHAPHALVFLDWIRRLFL